MVPGTATGARLCAEPLDVSGATRLPAWLASFKNYDGVDYPAHAVLGSALNGFGCHPTAAGLQWLKAAAHARTPQETARAADGLREAKRRAASLPTFSAALCSYVAPGFAREAQRRALIAAGLTCSREA